MTYKATVIEQSADGDGFFLEMGSEWVNQFPRIPRLHVTLDCQKNRIIIHAATAAGVVENWDTPFTILGVSSIESLGLLGIEVGK